MEIADTISYIRNNELKKLIALYKSEPNEKNPLSLGYDKDSIIKDIQAINEYRNMSHDNDRELTICIVAVMCHQTLKSNIDTLKELGYEDITEFEIYTIFSSIHSLKNIAEYKELDIKEYKISTCGDIKVCSKCSKHHNKKYLVSEAVLRKTMPPFCDKCRCVMLPQFDL